MPPSALELLVNLSSMRGSATSSTWDSKVVAIFAQTLGLHSLLDDLVVLLDVEVLGAIVLDDPSRARCLACPKRPDGETASVVKAGRPPAGVLHSWVDVVPGVPGQRVPLGRAGLASTSSPPILGNRPRSTLIGRPERRKAADVLDSLARLTAY